MRRGDAVVDRQREGRRIGQIRIRHVLDRQVAFDCHGPDRDLLADVSRADALGPQYSAPAALDDQFRHQQLPVHEAGLVQAGVEDRLHAIWEGGARRTF